MSLSFIYPKLPSAYWTSPFCRFSGNGLANCLFVYAKAIKAAKETGAKLITPTWLNFSIGPYLRQEKDKRHYYGLFTSKEEISGLAKCTLLTFNKKRIKVIDSMDGYFEDILDDAQEISEYIENHVCSHIKYNVDAFDFSNCIAVHVRLGDYPENVRVPISWYVEKIKEKKQLGDYKFLLFSDGSDEELSQLIEIPNVERFYFGNAIADILAISKCCYLIGSDSTFSGWGAYLGQVPCVFYRKHYGRVLKDSTSEIVEFSDNLWK